MCFSEQGGSKARRCQISCVALGKSLISTISKLSIHFGLFILGAQLEAAK